MNSPKHKSGCISAINVEQTRNEVCKFNRGTKAGEKNSWWHIFYLKCRQKEVGPGWKPGRLKMCPQLYCPSFRNVAQILALLVTVSLFWGVVMAVLGSDAEPGGQLFNIALLVVFAYLGGCVFRMLTLPALVGMLLVGIIYKNAGFINTENHKKLVSTLRKIALVVIFTRAGLDLDPVALKKLYSRMLFLALIPWCTEVAVIAVTLNMFLNIEWSFAIFCGSIIAAVAPAVVVPCLFRLRTKGYGVAKGIPTLIIAVAGMNDAASVIAFGIGKSMLLDANTTNSITTDLLLRQSLMPIGVGILYGLGLGFVVKYVPERTDPYVVPLRILILFGGGLLAVLGFERIELEGAGPLAVIIASFTSIYFWTKQGWNIEENPVATAFEIFWMIFEPILFGLTGTEIVLNDLDQGLVTKIVMCVAIASVSRIFITIIAASKSSLNFKEKLFIALSWMAKASVQAALGSAVADYSKPNNINENQNENIEKCEYCEKIAMVCIMSILLTAPMGAIIVSLSGTKLLTKAKPSNEQWRHGPRPSIHDIALSEDEDYGTSVSNDQVQESDVANVECMIVDQKTNTNLNFDLSLF